MVEEIDKNKTYRRIWAKKCREDEDTERNKGPYSHFPYVQDKSTMSETTLNGLGMSETEGMLMVRASSQAII